MILIIRLSQGSMSYNVFNFYYGYVLSLTRLNSKFKSSIKLD